MEFSVLQWASAQELGIMMLGLWLASNITGITWLVDAFWPVGIMITSIVAYTNGSYVDSWRKDLVLGLTFVWALRLFVYITFRNYYQWKNGEDFRYQQEKAKYGDMYWLVSFFKIFAAQELSMLAISSPIVNLMANESLLTSSNITLFDVAGVVMWSIGFYFELVADWQMTYFRDSTANKGKVLSSGLWAHCRHPNYFGETLIWWSMFLFNMNVLNGIFSIVSPLLVSYILMGISAPLVEDYLVKKKIGYRDYASKVPYYLPNMGITNLQVTHVVPPGSGQ